MVGRAGGSAGCPAAGLHLPKDWFSSSTACLLSKSPVMKSEQYLYWSVYSTRQELKSFVKSVICVLQASCKSFA